MSDTNELVERLNEAEETSTAWRRLALQFDEDRMNAKSWLKAIVDLLPAETAQKVHDFLKAPPLDGEKVLATRLAALAPVEAVPVAWPEGFFVMEPRTRSYECATEGCGQRTSIRVERDGIGSNYCEPCARKIAALAPVEAAPVVCATEGCDNPATNQFIRGGVGSTYCGDCFAKVIEVCAHPPAQAGAVTVTEAHPEHQNTQYTPKALYYEDADALEYVRTDAPHVYRRIDEFLTLILDIDSRKPVGFRIEGFRNVAAAALGAQTPPEGQGGET